MGKITIEDLVKIREEGRYTMTLRQGSGRVRITVHMGTCGIAAGARTMLIAVMHEIESRHLHDVMVTTSGCDGRCSQEPMMTLDVLGAEPPVKYGSLTAEKVKRIFDMHVLKGQVMNELALAVSSEKSR